MNSIQDTSWMYIIHRLDATSFRKDTEGCTISSKFS